MKRGQKKGIKGQSTLITSIILILLVIALLVVLWNFIVPYVKNTSVEPGIYTVSLDIPDTSIILQGDKLQIQIGRMSDDYKLQHIGIMVVGNETLRYLLTDIPQPLESKSYVLNIQGMINVREIIVYPLSDKKTIGNFMSQKITGNETGTIDATLSVIDPIVVKDDCVPHVICAAWNECTASYTVDELIMQRVLLEGKRSRFCTDANHCMDDVFEITACDPAVSVVVKKLTKCSKDYLEVYDTHDTLISRLDYLNGVLNIQFLTDKNRFFPYCYNGVQDCDEDGIDCVHQGDSCPLCTP